jgi:pimeloyl-ACP methyl ester carboxylesterase
LRVRAHVLTLVVPLLIVMLAGCSSPRGRDDHLVVLVPGVAGDGPWYDGLKREIRRQTDATLVVHRWGLPGPGFVANFNNKSIHEDAESSLAERLQDLRAAHPHARIDIITHSAGGGVALGALQQSADVEIDRLVLLHPAVSPGYDLGSVSKHVACIDVFHSTGDVFFLSWRASTFGTYDGVKTDAAGRVGFDQLPPNATQHEITGGHFAGTKPQLVRAQVAPLLVRSAEAIPR